MGIPARRLTWLGAATVLFLSACGGGSGSIGDAPGAPRAVQATAYVANAGSNNIGLHEIDNARSTAPLAGQRATAPAGTSPLQMAAHPSGQFLYATAFVSSEIMAYRIDPANGNLAAIQPALSTGAGFNAISIAVHPSGRFAYVGTVLNNPAPARLTPLGIDINTGAVRSLGGGAFAGITPTSIAIAPAGNFAYATDPLSDAIWVFAIDAVTGALVNVDPDNPVSQGIGPTAIAIDATGRFAFVANEGSNDVSTYAIDARTGKLTAAFPAILAGQLPASVAIHPGNGFLYVSNANSGDVSGYKIDPVSGRLSAVGPAVPAGRGAHAIAFDPEGKFAFVTNVGSNDISVFAINPATGVLQPLGARIPTGVQPVALVIGRAR